MGLAASKVLGISRHGIRFRLSLEVGDECASHLTDKDVDKLTTAGIISEPQLREALQTGHLQRLRLGNAFMAALRTYLQENCIYWVKSDFCRMAKPVECINGRIRSATMADILGLADRSMTINGEFVSDTNLHQLVQQLRESMSQPDLGSKEENAIRVEGAQFRSYMLRMEEWLCQPATRPFMTSCNNAPAPVSDTVPCTGWMCDGITTWLEFEPGIQQMLCRLKSDLDIVTNQPIDDIGKLYESAFEPSTAKIWSAATARNTLLWYSVAEINVIAAKLGLRVRYGEQGGNRSASFSDMLLLQAGQTDAAVVSKLVLAVGNVFMNLPHDTTLETAFQDPAMLKELVPGIQKVFTDAALDEAPLLLLTDGVVIFFLRRSSDNNILQASPPVRWDGSGTIKPLAALLYFAWYADRLCPKSEKCPLPASQVSTRAFQSMGMMDTAASQNLPSSSLIASRHLSHDQGLQSETQDMQAESSTGFSNPAHSSDGGSASHYPSSDNVQDWESHGMQALQQLPHISLEQMGYHGKCLGGSTHTRVFQGMYNNTPAALKFFDARDKEAVKSFAREAAVYSRLWKLQGVSIPRCLAVAQVYETGALVLVLQLAQPVDRLKEGIKRAASEALHKLHALNVCHGDVHLGNLLSFGDNVWFNDLEHCIFSASQEEKEYEMRELEECLTSEASETCEELCSV